MHIKGLRLYHFRNSYDEVYDFLAGINVLYGKNGTGKTNILEAINYIANFSSFRVRSRIKLIRTDEIYALIQAVLDDEAHIDIEIRGDGEKEKVRYNKKQVQKQEIKDLFSTAAYLPSTQNLVYGSRAAARDFFDKLIIQANAEIQDVYRQFKTTLIDRSLVLKTFDFEKEGSDEVLNSFTEVLTSAGSKIAFYRIKFIEALLPDLTSIFNRLTNSENDLSVAYESRYCDPSMTLNEILLSMKKAVAENSEEEKRIHQNLIGPQRDAITFSMNGVKIDEYASSGQIQIFCLALVLAAAKVLERKSTKKKSILLLDDIFAGIDSGIIKELFYFLQTYDQVFITSPNKETLPKDLREKINYVKI